MLCTKSDFGIFNFSYLYYQENPDMSETSGHASLSICTVGGLGMAGFSVAGGGATPPSQALSVAVILLSAPTPIYWWIDFNYIT